MDKNKKIIFLVIGVAFVAVAGLLVFLITKKNEKDLTSDVVSKNEIDKKETDENQKSIERQGKLLSDIAGKVECTFSDDRSAFSSAIKEEDIRVCDCINNDSMKEDCKTSVLDAVIYMQALDQYDLNICDGISIQAKKDACKSAVQSGIDSAKEKNPERLAEIYRLNNNYDGTITLLEESLSEEDIKSLLTLSLSYSGKGLSEQEKGNSQSAYVLKAIEYAEKAIQINPEDPEAYRVLAYAYEIKPDYMEATKNYDKAIELDPDNILAYIGRGHTADLQGFLEKALEDYKKAAELDTDKSESIVYSHLCRIESTRSDLYEEAIGNCKQVLESLNAKPYQKSEAHQILATMYMRHERLDEALTQLNLAMTYNPNDPNLYVTLGELHLKIASDSKGIEHLVEAEKYSRKAIEISSTKAGAYAVLSYVVYKQHQEGDNKLDEALEIAEKGLSLVDSDVSLLPGNKEGTKKRFYWTMANIYNLKGDKGNEEKYLNLIGEKK